MHTQQNYEELVQVTTPHYRHTDMQHLLLSGMCFMVVKETLEDVPHPDSGALFISIGERVVLILSWNRHSNHQ